MRAIKATIEMDKEHREKISQSKTLYHRKLTQLFNLLDEIDGIKKEIESKRNNVSKPKTIEKRII
jgi:hypothetical protein